MAKNNVRVREILSEKKKLSRKIAREIKAVRQQEFLTQKKLAIIAGFHQTAIARLEKGIITPSLSTLIRIAKAMGKQIEVRFVNDNAI